MSRTYGSPTMEKSTILRELADFDIKAPISVTISFDDDFDETLIKKEIVSDYQEEETQETVVSAFFPIIEPNKEIQAQTIDPCLCTEKQVDELQNNIQAAPATAACGPPTLNNELSNGDKSRKRKTENFEICKPKQLKPIVNTSDENNCDKENAEITFKSYTYSHNVQSDPNLSTSEVEKHNPVAIASVDSGLLRKEASNSQSDVSSHLDKHSQIEKDNIRSCIIRLASLSENMRRFMEAYGALRQQRISKEDFIKIKKQYFHLSHKTLVTILLPEEKNNDFLSSFLNSTLRRARKNCGPYYTHTYQDYANLLHEMLMWTKQTQKPVQSADISVNSNGKSEQPIKNGATVQSEGHKHSTQQSLQVSDTNTNTGADKICIFSSGPPERALSINIDPSLKNILQTPSRSNSNEWLNVTQENGSHVSENNSTTQLQTAVDCLTRFVANSCPSSTVQHRPPSTSSVNVIQPPPLMSQHQQQQQQHSAMSSNTQRCSTTNMSNYNNYKINYKVSAPLLQKKLEEPPLSGHLQHRPPPSYQQSLHFSSQSKRVQQATLPYEQYLHLQAQSLQQNQMPSQYNPAQLIQTQSVAPQFQQSQYLAQSKSQYGQTRIIQGQSGQSRLPMTQKNLPRQPPISLSQQDQNQQQLQTHSTESWPTMEELLSMESTSQLPYQSSNEEVRSSGQWQSRQQPQLAQQPQVYGNDWHQAQVYQGPVPAQTQKGPPRSASTDSGFISPLNFNVSADQTRPDQTVIDLCNLCGITNFPELNLIMQNNPKHCRKLQRQKNPSFLIILQNILQIPTQKMPTMPDDPESSMPMIVHVTSLSDKAAYIDMGKCVVCKKTTKQMCMGCMKVYYCNYQCQSHDWAVHAPHCSQQNYAS